MDAVADLFLCAESLLHYRAYEGGDSVTSKELADVSEQLLGLLRVHEIMLQTMVEVALTEEQRAEFVSRFASECMSQKIDYVTGLPK